MLDAVWIAVAFSLGLLTRQLGLPPLVGYLAAGFILHGFGAEANAVIDRLSDIGITLLLFTIGLKLKLRSLAQPHVWAVTVIHTAGVMAVLVPFLLGMGALGVPILSGLSTGAAALTAFALSFSSTVFTVKVLEDKGEMASVYGTIAIGILIVQDLAAVLFLAFSVDKIPSPWALLLLLFIPLRPWIYKILERSGHGELLVLFGLTLGLGGAQVFDLVGVKGDLGALALGVLIASHPKAGGALQGPADLQGRIPGWVLPQYRSQGRAQRRDGRRRLASALGDPVQGVALLSAAAPVSTAGTDRVSRGCQPCQLQRVRADCGGCRCRRRLARPRVADRRGDRRCPVLRRRLSPQRSVPRDLRALQYPPAPAPAPATSGLRGGD